MNLRILFLLISPFLSVSLMAVEPRSYNAWREMVMRDAKVSSLVEILGKPDEIKSAKLLDSRTVSSYRWYGAVDNGSKEAVSLVVLITEASGKLIVIKIYVDGEVDGEGITFPWTSKFYRLQKE